LRFRSTTTFLAHGSSAFAEIIYCNTSSPFLYCNPDGSRCISGRFRHTHIYPLRKVHQLRGGPLLKALVCVHNWLPPLRTPKCTIIKIVIVYYCCIFNAKELLFVRRIIAYIQERGALAEVRTARPLELLKRQ
jgi:hypothetical protein